MYKVKCRHIVCSSNSICRNQKSYCYEWIFPELEPYPEDFLSIDIKKEMISAMNKVDFESIIKKELLWKKL